MSEEKLKAAEAAAGEAEEEDSKGEEEEGTMGGFGGIRNQSVDEIIAKARFTESFLAASVSIGLTDDLEELARLGEVEENGTLGGPVLYLQMK